MDIMTGISAVSETLKITKELRSIDSRIGEAEWKLRLAEMVDKLLEAKEALIDAKENESNLRAKIEVLEKAANEADRLEDDNGLLFDLDESGKRYGEPYCNKCFVREQKKYRLIHTVGNDWLYRCHNCNQVY